MRADLIESMAKFLRDPGIDLSDEAAVFRTLQRAHFIHGDILAFSGEAVKLARGNPPSVIGETVATVATMVGAGAAWLAWYVVLCPSVS